MVKTIHQSVATRSSNRIKNTISSNATKATSVKDNQRSTKRQQGKIVKAQTSSRNRIKLIHDFKFTHGKNMYFVEREDQSENSWEPEDMIEDPDMVSQYLQKVYQETGYTVQSPLQTHSVKFDQRPVRRSKARAVMALKDNAVLDGLDDDDDMQQNRRTLKPKSAGKHASGGKRLAKGPKKTKAQIQLALQAEERMTRRELRNKMDSKAIVDSLSHVQPKECCLMCAAGTYRHTLENHDLKGFKDAFADHQHVPYPVYEGSGDVPEIVEHALLLGQAEFAEHAKKKLTAKKRPAKPSVPQKYTVYNSNTGSNRNLGYYNNQSYREVQESRGNRLGNSAFYRDNSHYSLRTHMDVEGKLYMSEWKCYLRYLNKESAKDEKLLNSFFAHTRPEPAAVYFAINSGNRLLANKMLDELSEIRGRSSFNHLHHELLKFNNGEPLTSYRRTQILKMASDAMNITPLHCAAIHPDSSYLAELYDQVDTAERLWVDTYGRSIAFYAAVSETSACLNFLALKGFSLNTHDKHKLTPLIQAARFGRSHNVELLVKLQSDGDHEASQGVFLSPLRNKRTALHYAAYFGHAATCKTLIDLGAPVDVSESTTKQTPLHFAAKNGYHDCVKVLIEEGKADPERGDTYSRNALHLACINGRLEVVEYLLSYGVDANAFDSSHNTASHYAAAFGYLKILHLLIEYGNADPSLPNVWRSTPCSVANMKGHFGIVKYLVNQTKRPIDINFKDENGLSLLQNIVDEQVETCLEMDANLEKAKAIVSLDANVNSTDIAGNTSLHTLASCTTFNQLRPKNWKHFYPVKTERSAFLSKNAKENLLKKRSDFDGIEYQMKLAQLLIDHGADLNFKNSKGLTPLAIAFSNDNDYLVAALISAGSRFWIDVDKDNNNFFHYFVRLLARIDCFQAHNAMDKERLQLFLNALEKIWKLVESKLQTDIDYSILANACNNTGCTPLIYGLQEAIKLQKRSIRMRKQMVKCATHRGCPNNSHGEWENGSAFEEHKETIQVDLTLEFTTFLEYMEKFIKTFHPDINAKISLPKDFERKDSTGKVNTYPIDTGKSALHLACQFQDTGLILFLLEHGADANQKQTLNKTDITTPLITAYHLKKDKKQELVSNEPEVLEFVAKRFQLKKPDFMENRRTATKALLEHGACPFTANGTGISPVFLAASKLDTSNLKQMCLASPSKGSSIDTKGPGGNTALMVAVLPAMKSNPKQQDSIIQAVEILLHAGANPNVTFSCGNTVLMKVIEMSCLPLVETILKHSRIALDHGHQNKDLETGLHIALRKNQQDIISVYTLELMKNLQASNRVANMFDSKQKTPLSYACSRGNLEAAKQLLELSADPNVYKAQSVPLIEAVKSCNSDLVAFLLRNNANIHACDLSGNSALHHAVLTEKHHTVDILLENLADPNCINARKQTPLHLAISVTKNQRNRSFRVEKSLVKYGANFNVFDFLGRTPLHYAFVDPDIIPLTTNTSIIQKKVKQICQEMKQKKVKENSLQHYIDKFQLREDGHTSEDISEWLIDAKSLSLNRQELKNQAKKSTSDQNLPITDDDRSSLEPYSHYKFEDEASAPSRSDPIEILKFASDCKDVNFDIPDEFGRTPLHYAACVGAFSCTFVLVEKKVNVNALDIDKNGPIQLALRNNHVDYSVMLCNFGAELNKDIYLKNGQTASTFSFSLSNSLINIAYIIMDKGVLLIKSIQDALKNGKFHMCEMLLQSADDKTLNQTLVDEQQNLWHIIADFKPFDNEIWLDYLKDIISRISSLSLGIYPDKYGRTPLHYAAKHGQDILLEHLINTDGNLLHKVDEDGKTALVYAAASHNLKCVQMILRNNVVMNRTTEKKYKSALLQSVEDSQFDIAKLLLENGASTDDGDSSFGWPNAVMMACLRKDMKMLKLLINHNADLNKPSYVERKDDNEQPTKVLVAPIFIASSISSKFLKMMLEGGASSNVYGPDFKPENGQHCFTYNISINSLLNQKLLLEHNVDLNSVEKTTSRTLFYQHFFGLNERSESKYTLSKSILDQMLLSSNIHVSHVDSVTGATPLERAIYQKDVSLITKLLELGADVNVESFDRTQKSLSMHVVNPSKHKIPAILHAALVNRLDILTLLYEKSQRAIEWLWQDPQGNSMLFYIFGVLSNYSFANISILQYILQKMDQQAIDKLLQMKNHKGTSIIMEVYKINGKVIYDLLISWYPHLNDVELKLEDCLDFDQQVDSMELDGNFISAERVEEEAQIERQNLQEHEKHMQAKSNKKTKPKDERLEIDQYSNLKKVGEICLDDNKTPYNVSLMKFEFSHWVASDISFYKLSIIYNKVLDLYVLWTRWGSFGFEGQHQKTPFLTKEEAVLEFKAIFKSKTGNVWETQAEDFLPKRGKYDLIRKTPHPKDSILKNFDFLESNKPTHLSAQTFDLMKLVCNFEYLSKVYCNTEIGMPLGQVPQKHIDEARRLLKEAIEFNEIYEKLVQCFNDKSKIQESKDYAFKISQNIINYRRLLPRHGEADISVRNSLPNGRKLPLELAKLQDLDYVQFAANVALAAKHNLKRMHPLEYAYQTLGCTLQPISLTDNSPEHLLVSNYMGNNSKEQYDILHLFSVDRDEESNRFRPFETEQDRKLLWHGSRIGNFMGILKQGLRPSPGTSESNGSMFGNGIYFADTFEKSLGYAHDTYGDHSSSYKILLLCEVALGKNQGASSDPDYQQGASYDSVKGEGNNIPNPECTLYDNNGVCIPCGPSIPYKPPQTTTNNNNLFGGYSLNYNEYIVYDADRVKIRYLVIIKNKQICHSCGTSQNCSSIKALHHHDVPDIQQFYFNVYEHEIAKAFLIHSNKTINDVFKEGLEDFLAEKTYKTKSKNPLDMNKESLVCSSCANEIACAVLEKRILMNMDQMKALDKQFQREQCPYGKKCRNRKDLSHAKKFKHWHFESIKSTSGHSEISTADKMDIDENQELEIPQIVHQDSSDSEDSDSDESCM